MAVSLRARIQGDLTRALKGRDTQRVAALRLVVDALQQEEISAHQPLSDAEAQKVLEREAKRRREASAAFRAGGRVDRADAEQGEAELIAAYLPAQLTDAELEAMIQQIVGQQGPPADQGKVMGAVMGQVRGRADGARVREAVSRILLG